ncbi:MAG TPA: septation protein A [Elusimicrobia bacterium]|nr:MAG: septation protein A [Elusimicrobia bacterium RIFOXYA12_FULL_49_49]OGS09567.1 MAG: septation protein A [Elusimicrobia bacterium RIFOXYA1_FULL_47_7]OGS14876.1 MAG: septation protein A [Elusimicrobia bacterium RIFOXYA2_FULL_47_53]OGS26493.1 MAG: septation protein A [Elusimicrobia bacterium RIFOXYB12_FULL_50_12]OGS29844.1 MAG: septation protein A [Elusimicrobia bacterium RIFOXYB2_FULL_46_23]HBU69904.1 septation protein A [Elusimicrobiota bacterium]
MKLLLDFLPIALFFAAFKFKGIYFATAIAIAVSFVQIAVTYALKRKVEPMALIGLGVLSVFGGFTLLLHNEMFIKWKPTILYWIFAAILFFAQLLFKKNPLKALLSSQMALADDIWNRLNIAWAVFFSALGFLNLFIAYHFSTGTWVNFKLFGLLGCTLTFLIAQAIYLSPHLEKENIKEQDK